MAAGWLENGDVWSGRFRDLARWSLWLVLFAGPLIFLRDATFDPYNVPKMALAIGGIGIAGAFVLLALCLAPGPRPSGASLLVPALVLGPLLIAWLASPYREWSTWGLYSRFQGLIPYLVFGILAVLVAYLYVGRVDQVAWALVLSGAIVGLYQLTQMTGFDPLVRAALPRVPSTSSTLGNSNFVGGFLAIVLPLAVHLWLEAKKNTILIIILVVLIGEGLVLSFSGGGQAAGFMGTALLIAHRQRHVRRVSRPLIAISVLIPLALVGAVVVNLWHPVGGRSAVLRSGWWKAAVFVAAEAPLAGMGPNAYAIEGVGHRSIDDAVAHRGFVPRFAAVPIDYQTSDDPHSVPLSFLANAGTIGLIGFISLFAWIAKASPTTRSASGMAFGAACFAYLTQSIVSVDEVGLRIAFWGALGAFLADRQTPGEAYGPRPRSPLALGRPWILVCLLGALALGAASLFQAAVFIDADIKAAEGVRAFAEGRVEEGEMLLRAALERRDEIAYRQVLAENLGLAAVEAGPEGRDYLERMRILNRYLEKVPRVGALHAQARILNYWGSYDQAVEREALAAYRTARRYDPENPLLLVEEAEVLADLGRMDLALRSLDRAAADRLGHTPDIRGALAMLRVADGDLGGADDALAGAGPEEHPSCRVLLARTLLEAWRPGTETRSLTPPFNLAYACDRGLYERFVGYLPDRARERYS